MGNLGGNLGNGYILYTFIQCMIDCVFLGKESNLKFDFNSKQKINNYFNKKVNVLDNIIIFYVFHNLFMVIYYFDKMCDKLFWFEYFVMCICINHPVVLKEVINLRIFKMYKYYSQLFMKNLLLFAYYDFIYVIDSNLINKTTFSDFNSQDNKVLYNIISSNKHYIYILKNFIFISVMNLLKDNEYNYMYSFFKKGISYSMYYTYKKKNILESKIYLKKLFDNNNYHLLNTVDYTQSLYNCFLKHNIEKINFSTMFYTNFFFYIYSLTFTFSIYYCIYNLFIVRILFNIIYIYYVLNYLKKKNKLIELKFRFYNNVFVNYLYYILFLYPIITCNIFYNYLLILMIKYVYYTYLTIILIFI